MSQCPVPCTFVDQHRDDMVALRTHLIEGNQCLDAWLALSRLVKPPRQRLDCLERAAVLAPERHDVTEAYLEARISFDSHDQDARMRLSELHTLRLLADVKTPHFHDQPRARLLGDILVESGAIAAEDLHEVLRQQQTGTPLTTDRRLGQMLLRRKLITPVRLARALILQQQERSQLRVAPQVLGEYLVAHNYITPQQLELALTEQLRLDQKGQRLSLGQILMRLNMISHITLEHAASEHQRAFWSQYG